MRKELPEQALTKRRSPWLLAVDVVLNVVIVFLMIELLLLSLFEPVSILGESMLPTVSDGDTVAMSKLDKDYGRGDIVIATKGDYYIIKRVVAVGGDTLGFARNGDVIELYVNDFTAPVAESYIKEPMTNTNKFSWMPVAESKELLASPMYRLTLDGDEVFLMGDNRNNSTDSRADGPYKISEIQGKMSFNMSENKFTEFIFNIIFPTKKESTQHD